MAAGPYLDAAIAHHLQPRAVAVKFTQRVAEIVGAADLPVSADLEDGFGASPETCAETIRLACETGLVGGSIEDATGNPASTRAQAD